MIQTLAQTASTSFNWPPLVQGAATLAAAIVVTWFGFRNNKKLDSAKAIRDQRQKHLEAVTKVYLDLFEAFGQWFLDAIRIEQLGVIKIKLETKKADLELELSRDDADRWVGEELHRTETALETHGKDQREISLRFLDNAMRVPTKFFCVRFLDLETYRIGQLEELNKLYTTLRQKAANEEPIVPEMDATDREIQRLFENIQKSLLKERQELLNL